MEGNHPNTNYQEQAISLALMTQRSDAPNYTLTEQQLAEYGICTGDYGSFKFEPENDRGGFLFTQSEGCKLDYELLILQFKNYSGSDIKGFRDIQLDENGNFRINSWQMIYDQVNNKFTELFEIVVVLSDNNNIIITISQDQFIQFLAQSMVSVENQTISRDLPTPEPSTPTAVTEALVQTGETGQPTQSVPNPEVLDSSFDLSEDDIQFIKELLILGGLAGAALLWGIIDVYIREKKNEQYQRGLTEKNAGRLSERVQEAEQAKKDAETLQKYYGGRSGASSAVVPKSTVKSKKGVSTESFNEHREEVNEGFDMLQKFLSEVLANQASLKGNVDEISRKLDRLLKEVDEARRAAAQAYAESVMNDVMNDVMNRVNESQHGTIYEPPALMDGAEIVDADEVLDITDE